MPHAEQVYYQHRDGGETVYTVAASAMKFGSGALKEIGADALSLGMKRVALYTDQNISGTPSASILIDALRGTGLEVGVFDRCHVEPTDISIEEATRFAVDGKFDGFVSLGGGSVMDTAKAANLFSCHPADVMDYVNAPIGHGKPIPGALKPHIACPTTCGTGSETTGIIVFDITRVGVKTGIASAHLKPTMAVIDPTTTYTLPGGVVASTGFDVLTHAIESYTARPYTSRDQSPTPQVRPPYQGANPYCDIGSLEAIRIGGDHILAGIEGDEEARNQLMFAATLAGMAFGSSGVHIPHALSYSIATYGHHYVASGYESAEPMVPHGIAVVMTAPAVFRMTGAASQQRHLAAAEALGADISGAGPNDAGSILADKMIGIMKSAGLANGLDGLGIKDSDIPAMAKSGFTQKRPLAQAPIEVTEDDLVAIYQDSMSYW